MENPYNHVPYAGSAFPQAHLNRLASRAILHGVDPPQLKTCRVLELGCGEGAHLIPMAMQFPESQFVGVDIAEMPIARATELAAELGLDNIAFRVADVGQLAGQPGECDFLIAHGLYSWIAPPVQEKMLELCGRVLATNGIAYISYNAYPAWHIREMTRNMGRIVTAGVADPTEIRNRTIALLAAIYRSQSERDPYREAIRAEMERILAKDPNLCFHDDFGEDNNPVYLREFVRRAAVHGLQFLAESEPADYTNPDFPPDAQETLNGIADIVEREQYYDFLTLRGFRRTLLCRSELLVNREIAVDRMQRLFYAASIVPSPPEPDLSTFAPAQFTSQNGASITVNQPFVKAILVALGAAWPGSLQFDDLVERARVVAPVLSASDAVEMTREVLLRLHVANILELTAVPYQYPLTPTERPTASRLARIQLRSGPRVTSLRHRPVDIDSDLAVQMLPLLDGTRTAEDVAAALEGTGTTVSPSEVGQSLDRLAKLCLLEA